MTKISLEAEQARCRGITVVVCSQTTTSKRVYFMLHMLWKLKEVLQLLGSSIFSPIQAS